MLCPILMHPVFTILFILSAILVDIFLAMSLPCKGALISTLVRHARKSKWSSKIRGAVANLVLAQDIKAA